VFQLKRGQPRNDYTVAFIGTDGTGKTTICKKLFDVLKSEATILYLGQKDYYLKPTQQIDKKKKLPLIRILFNYLFYPLDIWLKVNQIHENDKKIFIIDRLPGFPFANHNILMAFLYYLVLPRIDMLVLFEGDSEELFKRKNERKIQELAKDSVKWRKAYKNITASKKETINTVIFKTDQVFSKMLHILYNDPRFWDLIGSDIINEDLSDEEC
jgi:thymidylate kinase